MIGTENVTIDFGEDAIDEIAHIAFSVNETVENIGARRLHTVMEKLLDDISFTATDRGGETIKIDAGLVKSQVAELARDTDLSKFIL